MRDSSDVISEICRSLQVPFDETKFRLLTAQATSRPKIAFLGLVSRGKSYLVNELVGAQVCPVSAKNETPATIEIAHGQPSQFAWVEDGQSVGVGTTLEQFRDRVRRDQTPRVTRAEVSGNFRLPPGVVVVDTPGLNDASSFDDQLVYLEHHWTRSGASGAVAVISVPPGLAASDRRLLRTCQDVFNDRLVVVVKATDSSVEDEALHDVAELVAGHLGFPPIVLSNSEPIGPWGSGKTAVLERALERLTRVAQTTSATSQEQLSDLIEMVCQVIDQLPEASLPALIAVQKKARTANATLASRVDRRVKQLTEQQAAQRRVAEKERKAKELDYLNIQAARLRDLLPQGARSVNDPGYVSTLNELVLLAQRGSVVALNALGRFLSLPPEQRGRINLGLRELLAHIELHEAITVLRQATLTREDRKYLVERASTEGEVSILLTNSWFATHLKQSDYSELKGLRTLTSSPRMIAAINSALADAVFDQITTTLSQASTAHHTLDHALALLSNFNRSKAMAEDPALSKATTEGIRRQIRANVAAMRREVENAFLRTLKIQQYDITKSGLTVTTSSFLGRVRELEPLTKWLRQNASGSHPIMAEFEHHGPLQRWTHQCEFAQGYARLRAQEVNEFIRGARLTSLLAAPISGFMLWQTYQQNDSHSWNLFLMYFFALVALVCLIVFRATKNARERDWKEYFSSPPYDPASRQTMQEMVDSLHSPDRKGGDPFGPYHRFRQREFIWTYVVAGLILLASSLVPGIPIIVNAFASEPSRSQTSSSSASIRPSSTQPSTTLRPTTTTRPAVTAPSRPPTTTQTTLRPVPATTIPESTVLETTVPESTVLEAAESETTVELTPGSHFVDHPYFMALAEWSAAGAREMRDRATPYGPAWSYAQNLLHGFIAGASREGIATMTKLSSTEASLCLGSTCFSVEDPLINDGRIDTFQLNGTSLEEVARSFRDDAAFTCWYSGERAGCGSEQTANFQVASIYRSGNSTYVALKVDVKAGFPFQVDFISSDIIDRNSRITNKNVASSTVNPNESTSWLIVFDAIDVPFVQTLEITVSLNGRNYTGRISL